MTGRAPTLRIELLGGFVVQHEGKAIAGFTPLSSALLGYLAINLNRIPSREELLVQFWPDDEPDVGRHKLRQALHSIRRLLREGGCDPQPVLCATRETVRLNPAAVCTDVAEFEAHLAAAKRAADPDQRTRHLAQAAALYRGDLLPGCFQEGLVAESNRLAVAHLDLLHDLTTAHQEAGDLDHAIATARKVIRANPLVEEAHCDLMRLLAAKGMYSSVRRQYQELERVLDEELGEKPSEVTRALVESLRRIDQTVPAERAQTAIEPPRGRKGVGARVRAGAALPGTALCASHTEPPRPPDREAVSPHALSTQMPSSAPKHRTYRQLATLLAFVAAALVAAAVIARYRAGRTMPPVSGTPIASAGMRKPDDLPPALHQELWVRQVANAPDEKPGGEPSAITIDIADNIYVTGFVQTLKRDVDYLTLKYDSNGNLLWRATYNGPGNDVDRARFIAVDAAGNVYVTGDSDNGKGNGSTRLAGLDIATIKYGPDGKPSQTWPDVGFGVGVRRWNGQDDGEDRPVAMIVSESGDVFILGSSWTRGGLRPVGGVESALIKYNASGKQEWVARYNSGHGGDEPAGMARDRMGHIYVAVTSRAEPASGPETDFVTLQFDSNGKLLWQRRYGANNQTDDIVTAIGVTMNGNVYVTGEARGNPRTPDWERKGVVTVSYDSAGRPRWARGTRNEGDRIKRVAGAAVASDGAVLLAGQALSQDGRNMFRTVLRDSDGLPLWTRDFVGVSAYPVIVERTGVTCVCGVFSKPDGARVLTTLRYGEVGEINRDRIYRPPDLTSAVAMTLDTKAEPIVACQASDGSGKPCRITILKYPP